MICNSIKCSIYLDWTPIYFQMRWSMPNIRKSSKEENAQKKKKKEKEKVN